MVRGTFSGALDQANYCIWCHNQGKDSCSKGLKEKDGGFKSSPFGVPLAGCPLEEKISEMNLVKSQGFAIGALGIVTIDNPMCAGTGHRICNDCMKSCMNPASIFRSPGFKSYSVQRGTAFVSPNSSIGFG